MEIAASRGRTVDAATTSRRRRVIPVRYAEDTTARRFARPLFQSFFSLFDPLHDTPKHKE
jgi:hypothetical protein